MRTTLLTFIILTNLVALGQYPRQKALLEKIKPDLKQLHQDKVDSIAYFMPYYVGDRKGITIDRSASQQVKDKLACETSDVIYLLWLKNGKTYVTKYNECGKIKTINSDTITFIPQFAQNYDVIKNSRVKPFQLVNTKNDTLTSMLSHSGQWEITVDFASKKYSIKIDHYDLNQSSDKDKNINADYNNNLLIVKLLRRLNEQLNAIEFDKK